MNLPHPMQWLQTLRHRNEDDSAASERAGSDLVASFGMDAALGVDHEVLADISRWSTGDAPGLGDTALEPPWAARRLNGRSVI